MKALIGLINLVIWWAVPPVLLFLFSFVFLYSYQAAIHSIPFTIIYVLYFVIIGIAYGTCVEDRDHSMDFIPRDL
jgi:hypothetical protein